MNSRQDFHSREQREVIDQGVMLLVGLVLVLQLWLLSGTMAALLGGDLSGAWPAALASLACQALNWGLGRWAGPPERR